MLIYSTVAASLIVYIAWVGGPTAAWFATGLFTGLSPLFLWIVLCSDHAQRLESAAVAEEWVASEIGKLRREGWRVFNNVSFKAGDVDHVAIGPGGIVGSRPSLLSSPGRATSSESEAASSRALRINFTRTPAA